MDMDLFCLKKSCCFGIFGLRAASFVIAYIYLVADLVMSTVIITIESFLYEVKKSLDDSLRYQLPDIRNTEGVMLGLWFLMLPFITSLLVGLHKNQPIYVKAYLMGVFMYISLEIAMFVLCFVYDTTLLILTIRFAVIMTELYFLIIVRSYYYEMRRPN